MEFATDRWVDLYLRIFRKYDFFWLISLPFPGSSFVEFNDRLESQTDVYIETCNRKFRFQFLVFKRGFAKFLVKSRNVFEVEYYGLRYSGIVLEGRPTIDRLIDLTRPDRSQLIRMTLVRRTVSLAASRIDRCVTVSKLMLIHIDSVAALSRPIYLLRSFANANYLFFNVI